MRFGCFVLGLKRFARTNACAESAAEKERDMREHAPNEYTDKM
jgi:hypothetical protein